MSGSTIITLAGQTFRTHELTVAQVREWIRGTAEEQRMDVVDSLLFDDFTLNDFTFFTDMPPTVVDAATPSELRKVVDEIKKSNPHFFELRERLVTLGKTVQTMPPIQS